MLLSKPYSASCSTRELTRDVSRSPTPRIRSALGAPHVSSSRSDPTGAASVGAAESPQCLRTMDKPLRSTKSMCRRASACDSLLAGQRRDDEAERDFWGPTTRPLERAGPQFSWKSRAAWLESRARPPSPRALHAGAATRERWPRSSAATGAEATRMLWGGKIGRFQSSFEQLAVALGRVARMEFSDPPRRSYVPDIFPKVLLTGGVLPAILRARGVTWASPKKRCLRRLVPFR
jgi:hypothetical protein